MGYGRIIPAIYIPFANHLSARLEMGQVSRQINKNQGLVSFLLSIPGTLTSKQEDDLIPLIITFITKTTIRI